MQFRIHGQGFQTLAFLDAENVDYTIDTANMTEYKEEATKTLEMKITKNDIGNHIIQEGGFVSFRYRGQKYRFQIVKVEETKSEIRITADYHSNELLNETCPPYKGQPSRSLLGHLQSMPFAIGKDIVIGINEVSHQTAQIEYTSAENKLSRLVSVCGHFDAIPKFRISENRAGGDDHFIVDIFKRENFGRKRYDVSISDDDLDSFSYSVDMTDVYTAINPTSEKFKLTGTKLWYDKSGNIEFEQQNDIIYAKQAADRYPAFKSVDKWIGHHQDFNVDSEEKLQSEALRALKANCYPKVTIKASGQFKDFEIGDNVTVNLKNVGSYGFLGKMSVAKMTTDLLNDDIQGIEFSDFSRVASKISKQSYQAQQEILIPISYNVEFSSDNGTIFKNGQGQTTLNHIFTADNIPSRPFRVEWLKGDSTISLEDTATISASDLVDDRLLVTLRVYITSAKYIEKQITLTNVNDGVSGGLVSSNLLDSDKLHSFNHKMTSKTTRKISGSGQYYLGWPVNFEANKTYTLSFNLVENNGDTTPYLVIYSNDLSVRKLNNISIVNGIATFTTGPNVMPGDQLLIYLTHDKLAKYTLEKVKLEEGDRATPWSLEPSEISEQLETVAVDSQRAISVAGEAKQTADRKLDKTAVTLEDNGTVTKAGANVNGDTYATMIASNPDWAQKIGNTIKVNGNMLVQGAVTADKMSVDNLSALTANMGTITGGKLFLSETYTNNGEISVGSASMGNGELRFQIFNQTTNTFKDIFIDGNMIDIRQRSSLLSGAEADSVVQITPNSIQVVDNKGAAQGSGKKITLTNDKGFMKMQADYIKQSTRVQKMHAFPHGVQGYFVRIGDMVTVSFFRRITKWVAGEELPVSERIPDGFRPVVETNIVLSANVGHGVQGQGIFHIYPDGRITSTGNYTNQAVWSGSMSWVTSDNMPIVDTKSN